MSFETALAGVLPELQRESGVQAVFLTGSVARGAADDFSDLDLSVLVESDSFVGNTVTYRNGVLLSVECSTAAHRARAFSEPEAALWNLVSLQTGVPLHDPDAVFADLQTRARAVRWADLAAKADARAAQLLADNAEELHKVMGGLNSGDDAKPSENVFLGRARNAWSDSEW